MFVKRIFQLTLIGALFVIGFAAAILLRDVFHWDYKSLLTVFERKEAKPPPEAFLTVFTASEFKQFDQIYDQRQIELRDIIAEGSEEGTFPIPKGLFAQAEGIAAKMDYLNGLSVQTEKQAAIKEAMTGAYQLLKETYEEETAFLKDLPTEGQNVRFITNHIFQISATAQRSGFQFLTAMIGYRRLLAEAVGQGGNAEENQKRIQDLVILNALIEKYKARLNVSLEAI
jgi:hypothetical protein